MVINQSETRWSVVASSIRGPAHKHSGLPNQDSFKFNKNPGANLLMTAFVSDGHGSQSCFRSHLGAKYAVDVASRMAAGFFKEAVASSDFSLAKQTIEEKLPRLIVGAWRELVEKNIRKKDFTEKEFVALEDTNKVKVIERPYLAYGATLLGALIGDNFIVYLQLGDGDILAISEDGEVSRPIPKDKRFIANETVSLCTDKAWDEFSVSFKIIDGKPPALIMLSSDGYFNSFQLENDFLKAAADFYDLLRDEGEAYVRNNLKEWLEHTSAHGSGDDTTVVLIPRMSYFNQKKAITGRSELNNG